MLVHHSSQTYQEAASAAADHARRELEATIEHGRSRAAAVIEQVNRDIPADHIVPASRLRFGSADTKLAVTWNGDDTALGVHDHALSQSCERAGVPWKYAQDLRGSTWGAELLAHNLNRHFENQPGARYLVRSVRDQVRGVLSDRFRRLDTRPILESFAQACAEIGAVPVEGHALDTKVAIKALLPRVFEPVANEVMAFGIQFGNSDFGDGALSVREIILRLYCTNFAVLQESFRAVHLGGRLPDNVVFSERTYELDTRTSASAIRDLVSRSLGPERIGQACDLVRRANEERVDGHAVSAFLKKHLGVGDAEAVTEAFSSADVENLPPGQSSWRLSNALSWIAGRTQDEHKRLELERVAGLALPGIANLN